VTKSAASFVSALPTLSSDPYVCYILGGNNNDLLTHDQFILKVSFSSNYFFLNKFVVLYDR
jgi:hypothetical protein